MLLLGDTVTVVGELAQGPMGRVEVRRPPGGGPFYVTHKTLPDLVASITTVSRYCKYIALGSASDPQTLGVWQR